jgi:hypothetical protein
MELATIALINMIALYEGWLDDVIALFPLSPNQAKKRATQP